MRTISINKRFVVSSKSTDGKYCVEGFDTYDVARENYLRLTMSVFVLECEFYECESFNVVIIDNVDCNE